MINFLPADFPLLGLLAGLCVGAVAPVLGMFLTVKRQSLIADTLAHASLSGVAMGIALGVNPIIGAVVCALLAAVIIQRLQRRGGVLSGDAPLAVVMSGGLALAVVILSASGQLDVEALEFLFGDIGQVGAVQLIAIIIASMAVLACLVWSFRGLFLIAFDEDIARAQGMRVDAYNLFLAIATAVVVAVGMQVVGVLLMGALMVIPVLAAQELNLGFKKTTLVAAGVSLLSVFTGLCLSFFLHLATGGTIVLVAIAFFLLGLVVRALRS
ncbi:MAG: metal ABC transporter permease [Patescibacteria group bacterium]|jgi:zinc transport system permease protein